MHDRKEAALERLEDQIQWYDKQSSKNQNYYKGLKIITLIFTGLVPVLAAFSLAPQVIGIFGFLALVCEGLQQLNQYQANWISYRSTCEALKHEKYLFLTLAGHFRGTDDPISLLAEHVEALVSVEHAKWISDRRKVEHGTATTAREPAGY